MTQLIPLYPLAHNNQNRVKILNGFLKGFYIINLLIFKAGFKTNFFLKLGIYCNLLPSIILPYLSTSYSSYISDSSSKLGVESCVVSSSSPKNAYLSYSVKKANLFIPNFNLLLF